MFRYTLNIRFLLVLVAVLAVTAAAVWAVHRRQAGKQADLYLARADALERDGDKAAAADYLRRYLASRPTDTAARGRFGLLLADTATDAEGLFRALLVLDQALRDDPSRDDLRRRAARLGLLLGPDTRPGAIAHFTALIKDHPKEAGLYYGRGNCYELAEKFDDAVKNYRDALDLEPANALAAGRLAGILRGRLFNAVEADKVIKTLEENFPNDAAVQLVAAVYWGEVGLTGTPDERAEAERKHAAAAAAALKLDPSDPAAVQAAADLALARGRDFERKADLAKAAIAFGEAVTILEQGIAAARPPAVAATLEGRAETDRLRNRVAKLYHTRALIALTARRFEDAEAWLSRGLKALPDTVGLIGLLAEVYTRAGRLDRAEEQIDRLRKLNQPAGMILYREARVHAARNEWLKAASKGEKALPDLADNPDLVREARYFLAECYEQVGQPDRRQAMLREAVPTDTADPLWGPARVKLADALLDLGRVSEAARTYEALAARYPDANTPLARLLLAEQRRRPVASRDLSRIEAALAAAPPSAERDLLRIDLKYAKTEPPETEKLRGELEAVRDEYPSTAEPYLALAVLEMRADDPAAAARWLDDGERNIKTGDWVAFRLRRATLPTTPAADLPKLASGVDELPPNDRARLLVGLADVAAAKQAEEIADRLLEQAATSVPSSLGVRIARFERAVRTDRAKAKELLAELQQVDEPNGTTSKIAKALLLLREADGQPAGDKRAKLLADAAALLDEAEPLRPGWNSIPLARAAVRDLQGDPDGAIKAYRRAVELGARDADAIRRFSELLTAAGRFTELNDLLRDLPGSGGRGAAEAALAARDFKRAAELAGTAVPDDSRDADALVWLGRVRYLAGDPTKAEKPLRRAVQVAADRPAPWVALVSLLAVTDRRVEAEAVIADAGKQVAAADRPAVLAACYEMLGRPEKAADVYRALATERPTDPVVLKEAGRYALRAGRAAEAAELLRRAQAATGLPEAEADAVRRLLAISLASQTDHRAVAQALEVINDPKADGKSTDEVRARAIALAAQPDRKQRAKAVTLLEEMEAHTALSPDEHFLLAQLHAGQDDRNKARRRFAAATNARPDDPTFLAVYARWLLTAGDADAARPLVEKLRAVAASSLPTAELTARLAVADGKAEEAAELLLRHADQHPAFVLTLMEQLGLGEQAEPVVRKLATAAGDAGGAVLRAEYLGRRGRPKEGITLLREARATLKPAALAAAAVNVLYGGRRAGADDPRADELVADAARLAADDPKVLLQQALLADFRGRYEEAEALLRRVLAARPDPTDFALAANNLAFLLSARSGKHDEALTLLEQAKEVGPSPDLSDTKGCVLLAKGDRDRAAAIEAFADSLAAGGGPVVRYHLAAAYHANGDKLRAAADWAVAHRGGLSPLDLHPLERPAYERVKVALVR